MFLIFHCSPLQFVQIWWAENACLIVSTHKVYEIYSLAHNVAIWFVVVMLFNQPTKKKSIN